MKIYKIRSFFQDKRLPFHLPFNLLKSIYFKQKIKCKEIEKLYLTITFDVEPHIDDGSTIYLDTFFDKISGIDEKKTFFFTGNLISSYFKKLEKLEKQNEIGLHGYSHELWGDHFWELSKNPLTYRQKLELLNFSVALFKKHKLKLPKSFRAPYMLTNIETKKLLQKVGFKVDSSDPSHITGNSLPYLMDNLITIPVTSHPICSFKLKGIFPITNFNIFCMSNFKKIKKKDLINFAKIVGNFHEMNSIPPYLVFLAHSWEFTKCRKYNFCSSKNYKILSKIIRTLQDEFICEIVTISELACFLRKNSLLYLKNL